jgi:hypothetical protein
VEVLVVVAPKPVVDSLANSVVILPMPAVGVEEEQ